MITTKFKILPNILNDPFVVSIPLGETIFTKRVHSNFPIMLPIRVTYVELVEHDMFDFDVILCMDWLPDVFASIYFITMVVKYNFPNEYVLEWKG